MANFREILETNTIFNEHPVDTLQIFVFLINVRSQNWVDGLRWEFKKEKSRVLKLFFLVEILATFSFLGQDHVFFLVFLVKVVFSFFFPWILHFFLIERVFTLFFFSWNLSFINTRLYILPVLPFHCTLSPNFPFYYICE